MRTAIVLAAAALLARAPAAAGPGPRLEAAARAALGGKAGAVVVLEARSGRLLAAVNPQIAARRTFRPGSVFKIVTAWAALETGAADPREQIACRNVFTNGGARLRCSVPGGHGRVDMEAALANSCNVYFYHLSRKVGAAAVVERARQLGFGSATGLLGGGEKAGRMPESVAAAEAPLFAIGDAGGMQVTVAQMAEMARRLAVAEGTEAEFIRRAMVRAVESGTAVRAAVPGLEVAGKTGSPTREWGAGTHAWFVGFAPARQPRVALAVLVLKGHGRDDAAPVAGKILKAWFAAGKLRGKEGSDA